MSGEKSLMWKMIKRRNLGYFSGGKIGAYKISHNRNNVCLKIVFHSCGKR